MTMRAQRPARSGLPTFLTRSRPRASGFRFFTLRQPIDAGLVGEGRVSVPFTVKAKRGRTPTIGGLRSARPINICTFGAVGDGTCDDSAAIQSALAAATAMNGCLYIPPGTFKPFNRLSSRRDAGVRGRSVTR